MTTFATNGDQTVLLLGGTGRTGGRVMQQLLGRGVQVRAVVRSAERLPAGIADDPHLTVREADLLSLSDEEVRELVGGCDVVISCLGHNISAQGVFGKPRDLIARSVERVYRAIRELRSAQVTQAVQSRAAAQPGASAPPVKIILMTSVSVNRRGGLDVGRGRLERACLWALRGLVPPTRDNQRAADFLHDVIEESDPHAQWVVVRPDTLKEGEVTEYALREGLVNSLFRPGQTNMANVAHFMCELTTDPEAWATWRGKLPVIVNASSA